MMILFRRRVLTLTALALFLILIYLNSQPSPSRPTSNGFASPDLQPDRPHEPIDWSKVNLRYPVKQMVAIPQQNAGGSFLPKLQATFPVESPEARSERIMRLEAVKSNFTHAWAGYREYGWLADEVAPVSGKKLNPFGGWGATLVDSLGEFESHNFFDLKRIKIGEWIVVLKNMILLRTSQADAFNLTCRYIMDYGPQRRISNRRKCD